MDFLEFKMRNEYFEKKILFLFYYLLNFFVCLFLVYNKNCKLQVIEYIEIK